MTLDDRELFAALNGAAKDPEVLVAAAEQLARRLHALGNDDRLWRRLKRSVAAGQGPRDVSSLLLIRWLPILEAAGYERPPHESFVAGRSRWLLGRASEDPDPIHLDRLRDHVRWLAERLDRHLAARDHVEGDAPPATWWERLKVSVAHAWDVVVEVDRMSLIVNSLPDWAGAVAGLPGGPVPAAVQAVAGLVSSSVVELIAAGDRLEANRQAEFLDAMLRTTLNNEELQKSVSAVSGLVSKFNLAGIRVRKGLDPAVPISTCDAVLMALEKRLAALAAGLASAWPYLAGLDGNEATKVGDLLLALESQQAVVWNCMAGEDWSGARGGVEDLRTTLRELTRLIIQLGQRLIPPPSMGLTM